jgi:phosphoribosylformylglycinamidine synthase
MVKVGIMTGFGINADVELGQAFELAGAVPEMINVTGLAEKKARLSELQILAFPGGFSFGDHLGSGRVLGQLVKTQLRDELDAFVARGGLVVGICNGFQTLVKMGLLPNLDGRWTPTVSLISNEKGLFQDRWVRVRYNSKNKSPWLQGLGEADLPIRHGEGRFVTLNETIRQELQNRNLVALTYAGENPNGSEDGVGGLTDPTGRVFGLMPHPEAFLCRVLHPQWRRRKSVEPLGLKVFENAVDYWK